MSFWDDRRGQSMQIGAMLLFGMLVISMATYQVTVVPNQNGDVEFKHNEHVRGQLLEGRDAVLRTGATGTSQPVAVDLGTQFPSRTVFINPPAPSGTLETTDLGTVTVSGAVGTGEAGDFWDGTARAYTTRGFVYTPDYAEYQHPPTTAYEHSVLYDRFPNGAVLNKTGQDLVDGRRLNLVTLDGRLSTAQSGATTLDPRPVSASTRTISVSDSESDPVSVTLRTDLSEETWRDLLADEFDFADEPVTLESTNFDDGSRPAGWTDDMPSGETGITDTDANSAPNSMFLSGTGSVYTNAHDTRGSTSITVDYWWKMDEDHPPEDTQEEDLFVEYLDSDGTWVQIARYDSATVTPGTSGFAHHEVTDPKAFHSGFKLRFRQEGASSDDYWFVDDVDVELGGAQDTTNDRYISGFEFDSSTTPNTMTLTFERGVAYQLRLSKVGVGSGVDDTDAAYVVPVSGDELPVETGETREFTVEVRDAYNNPVSGVSVSVSGVPATRLDPDSQTTGEDGRATFTYTAPSSSATETITASFGGGDTASEQATFSMVATDGVPPALSWNTAGDWDAASAEAGVVHESNPYIDEASDDSVKLGYGASGPQHYWPFDEADGALVHDVAGDQNGERSGPALAGTGLASTTSFDFDGVDDHVALGAPDVSGEGITLSAWIRADSMGSSSDMRIITKATSETPADHYWQLAEDAGQLRFRLRNEHNGGESMVVDAVKGGSLPTGQWTHVAATYDGSAMRIYIDGTEVGSTGETGAIATNSSVSARIGTNPYTNGQPFDGQIDEVQVYDRGLSASEIQGLYGAGSTGSLTTDWKNTGTTDVSRLQLRNVVASLPTHTGVTVYVESDTNGDGTADQTSNAIELDGSGGPYTVSGLTTDAGTFRLRVELSTTDPSVSPTFSGAELSES